MSETVNSPMWDVCGCTVRGTSHARAGLPNQDALRWQPLLPDSDSVVILAISDGHGSKKSFRSAQGSQLAVDVLTELLQEFDKQLREQNNLSAIRSTAEVDLPRKIVQFWQEKVEAHLAANPLTNDELANLEEAERKIVEQERLLVYGATLLGVLITSRYILYLQLGDGDILTVSDDGKVSRPLPPDDRQFANETLSLCSPGVSGGKRLPFSGSAGAWTEFRIRFQPLEPSPPALILVSTDGYANSFRGEADFRKVGSDFWKMIREEGIGYVRCNLREWLSEASKDGSGDDVTLGLIYRADMALPVSSPPTGRQANRRHKRQSWRQAYRLFYRFLTFHFSSDGDKDIDMSELPNAGQTIRTDSGSSCQVEGFLGGGGQGEVYRVNWNGQPFALKWYFPHTATPTQRKALQTLVQKGSPAPQFLWPVELASQSGLPGYGYLMRLRESHYKGILDLMKRKVEPTFKTLATAGLQLADCYLSLHARGFCYCDISFGNVFWNSQTGEVLICDNDNVIVNGEKPEIGGTIGFMAPEVVIGAALPSMDTDKYSLAVLLFYMFMLHHPLEGKRETAIKAFDLPAKVKLYGTEPIFIFDPNNDTNRPDARYHQVVNNFWPIYPQFFRDLFTKAFTNGLRDSKHGRVTENEWKAVMARLRDSILYCQKCAAENFYDADALKAAGGKMPPCWSCGTDLILPFRIRIGKTVAMLNHDSRLYPHHLHFLRKPTIRQHD